MTGARSGLGALTAAAMLTLVAGQSVAQTALDDPLDDHSAKRIDRMEKVVRELQGHRLSRAAIRVIPVVVQPADTDTRLSVLSPTGSAMRSRASRS